VVGMATAAHRPADDGQRPAQVVPTSVPSVDLSAALLRGEQVEWERWSPEMMHPPRYAPRRSIKVPSSSRRRRAEGYAARTRSATALSRAPSDRGLRLDSVVLTSER